jgi:hypothetical protein
MNSKHLLSISFLIVSCFLFNTVGAQSRVVTGKVTAQDNGSPLSGVSILVKGTSEGTNSASDGTFKISVTGKSGTLVFSHVGYSQKEVTVGSSSYLSVSMETGNNELSEVVVTALGIKKERASL